MHFIFFNFFPEVFSVEMLLKITRAFKAFNLCYCDTFSKSCISINELWLFGGNSIQCKDSVTYYIFYSLGRLSLFCLKCNAELFFLEAFF